MEIFFFFIFAYLNTKKREKNVGEYLYVMNELFMTSEVSLLWRRFFFSILTYTNKKNFRLLIFTVMSKISRVNLSNAKKRKKKRRIIILSLLSRRQEREKKGARSKKSSCCRRRLFTLARPKNLERLEIERFIGSRASDISSFFFIPCWKTLTYCFFFFLTPKWIFLPHDSFSDKFQTIYRSDLPKCNRIVCKNSRLKKKKQ